MSEDEDILEAEADQASQELEMMSRRKILINVSDDKEEGEGWIARRMKRRRTEGKRKPRKAKVRPLILSPFQSFMLGNAQWGLRIGFSNENPLTDMSGFGQPPKSEGGSCQPLITVRSILGTNLFAQVWRGMVLLLIPPKVPEGALE